MDPDEELVADGVSGLDEMFSLVESTATRLSELTRKFEAHESWVRSRLQPAGKGKGKGKGYLAVIASKASAAVEEEEDEEDDEEDEPPKKQRFASATPHRMRGRAAESNKRTKGARTDPNVNQDYKRAGLSPVETVAVRAAPPTIPEDRKGTVSAWSGCKYPRSACPLDNDLKQPLYASRADLVPQFLTSRGDYDLIYVRVNAKLWSWVENSQGLTPCDVQVAVLKNLNFPAVPLNRLHLNANMGRIRAYFPGVEEVFFEGNQFRDNVFIEAFYPTAAKLKVCLFPNLIPNDPRFTPLAIKSIPQVNSAFDFDTCSEKSRIALRPQVYYARQLQKHLHQADPDSNQVTDDFESSCDEEEEEEAPKARKSAMRKVRFT